MKPRWLSILFGAAVIYLIYCWFTDSQKLNNTISPTTPFVGPLP